MKFANKNILLVMIQRKNYIKIQIKNFCNMMGMFNIMINCTASYKTYGILHRFQKLPHRVT